MPSLPRLAFYSLLALGLGLANHGFAEDAAPAPRAPLAANADGSLRVDVMDFGAKNGGRTFSTAEIQKAIDTVAAKGGGTVVIPEGTFLTGALFLKPGVNLHLARNATLRGSTKIEDYPLVPTRMEGHALVFRPALLNAENCPNLKITGEGVLDGSGAPYWQEFWRRIGADKKTKNLDVERPRLLFISKSDNVVISGIQLKDSGFWNLHLYRCRGVLVENVRIEAPLGAPSTDGIDVDSCQDVHIRGCHISVDDDNIALKGSKGPDALEDKDSPPVDNIHIENCTFGLGNGMVTLGSEATVVRNVLVEKCRIQGPTGPRRIAMLRLKLRPDTPQTYENITVRDITLDGVGQVIVFAPWTQYFDLKGRPAPESTVRNVSVSNIHGRFERMGGLRGHDKTTISDITLENIELSLKEPELQVGKVGNLQVRNVLVNGEPLKVRKAEK